MAHILPQFPVGSVVLPHTPVELRVFEQRYLALMGELMVGERPVFGIPLFGQSVAAGEAPEQLTIGTTVRVDDFGVTDDFMGIQGTAGQRYVVTRWLEPAPYPLAEIEYLPNLSWDERLESERIKLELDVRTLLARVERHRQLLRGSATVVSDDPVESVWQLASLLPLEPLELMVVLAAESMSELIERVRALCEGGQRFLDEFERADDAPDA